jgi:ATP-dependent Clp protease ATP-binding subunit ClpC
MVGPGDSTRAPAPGADRPFTTRTQAVLALAAESARALGQSQVGTGHVLVGIMREGRGVGAQVLGHHGLTTEAADAYVRRLRQSDGRF